MFQLKNLQALQPCSVPIRSNSKKVPENWFQPAKDFFWKRALFGYQDTKEHIQKGMRHSQLSSCNFILQQLGIRGRIVLEWRDRFLEPCLRELEVKNGKPDIQMGAKTLPRSSPASTKRQYLGGFVKLG